MALAIDTLNSVIKAKPITDGFVSQVYTQSPFLDFMRKGKAFVSRRVHDIRATLLYNQPNTFGAWSGSGTISLPSDYEALTEAVYNWGFYVGKDLITYKQWQTQEKTEDAILDFAQMRLTNLANSISKAMEANLFAEYDGSNHTVFGIPDIVSTTDPTNYAAGLGNIKVADLSLWKTQTATYSSTDSLAEQMYSMLLDIKDAGGDTKIIITDKDALMKYAKENYDKSGFLVQDRIPMSLGFKSGSSFQGIPIVMSDNVASGTMYFLDTDYLKLVVHPDANFKSTGWKQVAVNDLDLVNLTTLTYALICSKRNAQGVITGIS